MKIRLLLSILLFTLLGTPFHPLFAGFGISPPYVTNDSLGRGSSFEQKIFLVRGDPVNDLKAEILVNVNDVSDWFEIVEGTEFILPRGQTKIPMTVRVKVPDNARYDTYSGNIKVRTSPVVEGGGGSVSIALGAQIDVNIRVTDEQIVDFRIRKINISDLNEGKKIGPFYFPGKIRLGITVENIGNAEAAPSEVVFEIYDSKGNELLEQTKNTNKIKKVAPFETKEVFVEMPTRLPPGGYLVRYRIFNGDEINHEGELSLSILPIDTIAAAGYGFFGLSTKEKATIVIPVIVLFIIVLFIVSLTGKRRTKPRRK
jgi:hypothetical protein